MDTKTNALPVLDWIGQHEALFIITIVIVAIIILKTSFKSRSGTEVDIGDRK